MKSDPMPQSAQWNLIVNGNNTLVYTSPTQEAPIRTVFIRNRPNGYEVQAYRDCLDLLHAGWQTFFDFDDRKVYPGSQIIDQYSLPDFRNQKFHR